MQVDQLIAHLRQHLCRQHCRSARDPKVFTSAELRDLLQPCETFAGTEIDQMYPLCVAPDDRNLACACTDQLTGIGDQHHLVFAGSQTGTDGRPVALVDLNRDHPLTASAMPRVIGQ